MKKKSIAKNYIYNLTYQLLTIFLPLITTPYLSRILGAKQIGIYGYTTSIVSYFILFGSLGASMYGQREIAYHQNDINKRSKTFYEIVLLRGFALTISLILFFVLFALDGNYSLYYKILLIQLTANIFDISWLFQGIEEFDKTVVRNLIVKLLCLILIFTLVRDYNDLWLYFLIYAGAEFIGNISIWLYLPKYIKKIKIKTLNIKKHFKPMIMLLLPQIAIQIYTVLDKTMIGLIVKNMEEVGYYEQSQKIVKAALMLVGALQTIMNSRIANAYVSKDKKEIKECLEKSFNFVWFICIPVVFGLIATASHFVPWYYGKGFETVTDIIIIIAPILIAVGLNGITGVQYLVQIGEEKKFTKSVIFGASINVILNIIFISKFNAMGAAFSSVIAEFSIFFYQLRYFDKSFKMKEIFKLSYKCLISSLIMFVFIIILKQFQSASIINSFIQVVLGGIIYLGCLLILKYKFLNDLLKQILSWLKNFLRVGEKNEKN